MPVYLRRMTPDCRLIQSVRKKPQHFPGSSLKERHNLKCFYFLWDPVCILLLPQFRWNQVRSEIPSLCCWSRRREEKQTLWSDSLEQAFLFVYTNCLSLNVGFKRLTSDGGGERMGDLAGKRAGLQEQNTNITSWSQQPPETKTWLQGSHKAYWNKGMVAIPWNRQNRTIGS